MGNSEALWDLGTPEHSVGSLLSGPGEFYLVNQEGCFCWKPDLEGQSYLRIQVKCSKESWWRQKDGVLRQNAKRYSLSFSPHYKVISFSLKIALIFWRHQNKTQTKKSICTGQSENGGWLELTFSYLWFHMGSTEGSVRKGCCHKEEK